MRETMLHLSESLSGDECDKLCAALEKRGGSCRASIRSGKPHLYFVAYDQSAVTPRDLVRAVADEGYTARVVDM